MAQKTPAQIQAEDPADTLTGAETFHMSQGSPPLSVGATTQQVKDFAEKLVIDTRSGTGTLTIGNAGGVVEMDAAGANNLTIPPNSAVAFPVGTQINIVQVGAGQTTVLAGSGVTLRNPNATAKTRAQWSMLALYKRGTNEWVLAGDVAES